MSGWGGERESTDYQINHSKSKRGHCVRGFIITRGPIIYADCLSTPGSPQDECERSPFSTCDDTGVVSMKTSGLDFL